MSDEKLDFFICGTFRKEILERISELERQNIGDNLDNIDKKLIELENEQKAFIDVCQEPCKDCKLNELKEAKLDSDNTFMYALQTHTGQIKGLFHENHRFKEVLRDLFTNTKDYDQLLEKLDGVGSASARESLDRQTEKKEPINDLTDNSWKEIFKETEFTVDKSSYGKGYVDGMKASGGVKDTALDLEGCTKPPEPTCDDGSPLYPDIRDKYYSKKLGLEPREDEPKCEFCGRNSILYKHKWICGHGCTKPAVKADEPREDYEFVSEDDMINYFKKRGKEVVKREDLSFLFDCIDDDICLFEETTLKRIKEEYKL